MAILGLNCKLYSGTAGSKASSLLTNVKDVTINLTCGEADVTTRASNGWRAYAGTLKEGSVEFQMNYDISDSGFTAIQSAFNSNEPISLFVETGETTSSSTTTQHGLDADFYITGFTIEQPLENAETVSVTARPTYITRAPSFS